MNKSCVTSLLHLYQTERIRERDCCDGAFQASPKSTRERYRVQFVSRKMQNRQRVREQRPGHGGGRPVVASRYESDFQGGSRLFFLIFLPHGDPILIEQAQSHYPAWKFTYSLRETLEEI